MSEPHPSPARQRPGDGDPPAVEPLISVCILAGHGLEALNACLRSLTEQVDAPPFELLIGGSPTAAVLAIVHDLFPEAQVCHTGRRLPGAARNPLISRARGELLLFLDDDVTAPPDLLRRLSVLSARFPQSTVFGGPNLTPPSSSRFQIVQGAVLSSAVGAGPVSRRYGARHPGPADERWFTLCNLAVRRRAMRPFLDDLVCAEENALLSELRRRGEQMRYDPSLRVFHARRPTWRSFVAQLVKYGRGRGDLVRRRPSTARAAYLAPSLLLMYLVLLVPALLLIGSASWLVLAPAALYGFLTLATAAWIGWTLRTATVVPLTIALIVTVHLCYGWGVLRGLVRPGRFVPEPTVRWAPSVAGTPGGTGSGRELRDAADAQLERHDLSRSDSTAAAPPRPRLPTITADTYLLLPHGRGSQCGCSMHCRCR